MTRLTTTYHIYELPLRFTLVSDSCALGVYIALLASLRYVVIEEAM